MTDFEQTKETAASYFHFMELFRKTLTHYQVRGLEVSHVVVNEEYWHRFCAWARLKHVGNGGAVDPERMKVWGTEVRLSPRQAFQFLLRVDLEG
jgi:hypothetical protein